MTFWPDLTLCDLTFELNYLTTRICSQGYICIKFCFPYLCCFSRYKGKNCETHSKLTLRGLKQCLRALHGNLDPTFFILVFKIKMMERNSGHEKVHVICCKPCQNVTFDLRSRGQIFRNWPRTFLYRFGFFRFLRFRIYAHLIESDDFHTSYGHLYLSPHYKISKLPEAISDDPMTSLACDTGMSLVSP